MMILSFSMILEFERAVQFGGDLTMSPWFRVVITFRKPDASAG
jgi:hypothetical protein